MGVGPCPQPDFNFLWALSWAKAGFYAKTCNIST
jgi:hypothetical protein